MRKYRLYKIEYCCYSDNAPTDVLIERECLIQNHALTRKQIKHIRCKAFVHSVANNTMVRVEIYYDRLLDFIRPVRIGGLYVTTYTKAAHYHYFQHTVDGVNDCSIWTNSLKFN